MKNLEVELLPISSEELAEVCQVFAEALADQAWDEALEEGKE